MAAKQFLEIPNRLKLKFENEIALEKVDESLKKEDTTKNK